MTSAPFTAEDSFTLPIDVQHFLNAMLFVAEREDDGFGLHEIVRVEEAWEIVDADIASHGFILALEDGRRVYLEYTLDHFEGCAQEEIDLVELAPGMERPDLSEGGGVNWYRPERIALYLAAQRRTPGG